MLFRSEEMRDQVRANPHAPPRALIAFAAGLAPRHGLRRFSQCRRTALKNKMRHPVLRQHDVVARSHGRQVASLRRRRPYRRSAGRPVQEGQRRIGADPGADSRKCDIEGIFGVADHGLFLEIADDAVRRFGAHEVESEEAEIEHPLRGQHGLADLGPGPGDEDAAQAGTASSPSWRRASASEIPRRRSAGRWGRGGGGGGSGATGAGATAATAAFFEDLGDFAI